MAYEMINTARAAQILGVTRPYVIQLIHNKTITTAIYGAPDGYVGKPGYIMELDEIYSLADAGVGKRVRKKKVEVEEPKEEQVTSREDIKKALEEVQVALGLLTEAIAKLREEL